MTRKSSSTLRHATRMLGLALVAISIHSLAWGQDVLEEQASWTSPTFEAVRGQFLALADEQQLAEADRERLAAVWADAENPDSPPDVMAAGLKSIAILAPQTAEVTDKLLLKQSPFEPIDRTHLADESLTPWLRHQLALGVGIWFTQNQLYDEAVETLAELKTEDVIDPASLLFYRGLAHQQIIKKDDALADLKRLLEREGELPRRYQDVSRLVVADLEPLERDSLDEIARMMADIRRRQGLYRSGTRVRQEEDDVIAKLDKLIEELEKQQQQMMMASAANAPSSPAPDSMLKGGAAPGDVDQKAQGSGEDWGDLPAKERAAAMAELAKDLPSHYRELIEEYYRKLAEDPNASDD